MKGKGVRLISMLERFSPSMAGIMISTLAAYRGRSIVPFIYACVGSIFAPRRRILCNENPVRGGMLLCKLFAANRYRAVVDPMAKHDASLYLDSPLNCFVVNGRHIDNSKQRVAKAWEDVSGQALTVDPILFEGKMVEKSDANATHDGQVLIGPIESSEVKAGKVYQRLIDNSDEDEVIDIRVPIFRGHIPFVYLKRRPISSRFSNKNTSVSIVETSKVLSPVEQDTIARFADLVGLDFGEADVLRDNTSQLIWAVDSTNGPAGPPNGLSDRDAKLAVKRLAEAFDSMFDLPLESINT